MASSKIDKLIAEFLAEKEAMHRSRWRQVDLAAAVYAEGGPDALRRLSAASGLTRASCATTWRSRTPFRRAPATPP
jgi:hypothetical protein